MSLKELLAADRLERHKGTREQIAKLFEAAEKYFEAARNASNAPTIRYVLGYTSALECAKAVFCAAGDRTRGPAQHDTAFRALGWIIGAPARALSSYLNRCRRMRNMVTYEEWVEIPEEQVKELVERTKELRTVSETWIKKNHPALLR